MAECVLMKSGSGADLDVVTAVAADVVAPKVIVGQDGEPVTGTMVDRGNWNATELAAGASVTIPAGRHGGSGKVTAKSLAAQTGGATATDQYVKSGMTYWKDGVKRTGTMTVSSVVSFSVAPYSTSQVIATWKNPGKGPYGHFTIGAKIGSYPTSAKDSVKVWSGAGSNSALGATNSAIISGLNAGQLYYFSIWTECDCSGGWMTSSPVHATCTPTAHGRAAFTSSGTWTVPAGVRSVNIHCTGGGGAGFTGNVSGASRCRGGDGGGGGYTSYKSNIAISPGQKISVTVGSGGTTAGAAGGSSSAVSNGAVLVSANGGNSLGISTGGSGGGGSAMFNTPSDYYASKVGASNGNKSYGNGQGTTTREFGTGTLYSGGGGGGGTGGYHSGSGKRYGLNGSAGGDGGGGKGGGEDARWGTGSSVYINKTSGVSGAAGTGGGGGGNFYDDYASTSHGTGGSGNVIIAW